MRQIDKKERVLAGRLIAAALLWLFFTFALDSALVKSPTVDEPIHFLRGAVLGQTGSLSLQYEHAPLSHRLIGALLLTEATMPNVRQLPSWATADRLQIARELVWKSGLDVDKLFFLARLPIIWLGFLLGALVGSWTLSWLGRWAMVVALTLFATSPNLIASSSLATTDLAAAFFYFATVYAWWRHLQFRGNKWWLVTAVFLGFALATKLTAVLLLPLLLVLAFLFRRGFHSLWRLMLSWIALWPIALVVLWFVYDFEFAQLDGLPFAVPAATYVRSWQNVLGHIQGGHAAYFLGELSSEGWWSYFPVTFLIKTPMVTLVLLFVSLMTILWRRELWRTAALLFLPALALTVAAMVSRLNIGYRHILPALPFLLVLAATAVLVFRRFWLTRMLLIFGLAWSIFSGLKQHPDHLAYFNEFAGGTDKGYLYQGDSNLDWGQDLKQLARTIEQQGGQWFVSYAGVGDPSYYGLPREILLNSETGSAPFVAANPLPGTYALSANHLQGLLADGDLLDWFRHRKPFSNLGGSILVYKVEEQASGAWIAHCLDPTPLLSSEEAERLVDQVDMRHLFFDCRQSWILPGGGEPGWYIMPQADNWWFLEQMPPQMAFGLQLVYRHKSSQFGPSYDVYYWSGASEEGLLAEPNLEVELENGQAAVLPRSLNNSIGLDGYRVSGDSWLTEWSIGAAAPDPLSLQAHLYTGRSAMPLVGDSLGFSSEQWRTGDRLLQRFEFPEHELSLYLETGAYNYLNLETAGEILRLPND